MSSASRIEIQDKTSGWKKKRNGVGKKQSGRTLTVEKNAQSFEITNVGFGVEKNALS